MNDSNAYNDDSKNKNDSEENNGNSDIEVKSNIDKLKKNVYNIIIVQNETIWFSSSVILKKRASRKIVKYLTECKTCENKQWNGNLIHRY